MTRRAACFRLALAMAMAVAVVIVEGRRTSATTSTTTTRGRRFGESRIEPNGPGEELVHRVTVRGGNYRRRRPVNATDGWLGQAALPSWHPLLGTADKTGRELEDGSDDQIDMNGDANPDNGLDDDYYKSYFYLDDANDDRASNWCSPDGAHKHYGDHYHLHEGSYQRGFEGYMCFCASMGHQMLDFECTSCVACDGPICTMRNVSLQTEYDDRDDDQTDDKAASQTLSVCTKFVNDFQPFRDVEICGIVHSPDAIADASPNQTTVSYSVNGILCASTKRVACTGTTGTYEGFLVNCSNAGYRRVMNTCNGNGLTGPWKYLYQQSNQHPSHRMKVNPFLTIGVSFTHLHTLDDDCPNYDRAVTIESPKGSWVLPQLFMLASIVSIGSLYRTLS